MAAAVTCSDCAVGLESCTICEAVPPASLTTPKSIAVWLGMAPGAMPLPLIVATCGESAPSSVNATVAEIEPVVVGVNVRSTRQKVVVSTVAPAQVLEVLANCEALAPPSDAPGTCTGTFTAVC